ncbi:pro-sigmaK processing inhibitor BofA family protein [Shouchella shacheensis]|uniref:pro-sigmaK processing inhibitor BofA family protein n=1 Tax=Shouchella shacheensis TaxID=1649580 RepID=UPI00073FD97D|nr:pro-sigmaK processing inhibitor BofA family protein [Shouchella shacheensis]
MEPWLLFSILGVVVLLLLTLGAPMRPIRLLGQLGVRLVVGTLLLFLINAVGGTAGLFVPINGITAGIAAILGIPGVAMLIALQYFVVG